jgi:hypothetical protein
LYLVGGVQDAEPYPEKKSVYTDRVAGGDCNHCRDYFVAIASRSIGTRSGKASSVYQQSQADWSGLS